MTAAATNRDQLRVLFATSECAPLVKTGGLADVSAALPAALGALGHDIRILLPGYREVLAQLPHSREIARVAALADVPGARLLLEQTAAGVALIVLDCPELYDRSGGPYQTGAGVDWPDNAMRFGLLSRVAALLGSSVSPLDWQPQVLHCNDWQTGLAPAYLRHAAGARAATLLTVHNLAFQGIFEPRLVAALGLPAESFGADGVEFYGKLSFLKAGLQFADAISTVSPGYAREIQDAALGFGLHGLLSWRKDKLYGILNGIDTSLWNPATDPLIECRYSADTLASKAGNKRALQRRLGLASGPELPLFAVVSRLTEQKGLDWLLEITPQLLALPAQLALLGSGDPQLERGFLALSRSHPQQLSATIGFDEPLAHLIEAGADAFLMPSRFEPCGMNQMYSQRYGTPPVVRSTGGLADTVIDCNPATLADGSASGFVFHDPSARALLAAIERAAGAWRDAAKWRALQRNAMARDFSWAASARRYAGIYAQLAAQR
ncbi:MAG: glycogen synthase GlgA [Burkholderiales bacterium]|nr:glycogen synthase GlgA [Burkholderiales bacterium]